MLIAVVLAAALQAATADPDVAAPQVQPAAPDQIQHPHWLRRPTGDDVAAAYPLRAQNANVSGTAVIKCEVRLDGRLQNCMVVSEDPSGWDFGNATAWLSRFFIMAPPAPSADGRPWTVNIPMRWVINP